MGEGLNFRILGPIEVEVAGNVVLVNAPKLRVLLAMLLLSANSMVSADSLVDQLWDQAPPRGARATLQTYVQRLRRVIGDAGRITTVSGGYRITVEPGELDLDRFFEARERARQASGLHEMADALRESLSHWRGPALADIPSDLFRTVHAPRLERERLAALEDLFDAELGLGRHRELVHELQVAADAAPLRERLHGQLMLALHRSGQQAEAFSVYDRIKRALATELGVDPGVELQKVHEQVLAHDQGPAGAGAGGPAAGELVPHELPADIPDFVGREQLVGQVEAALGGDVSGVPVVVISGLPGVGKTSLAVKVAHGMRGRFPDGQLHVDLRGHAATPALTPTEVLARFVVALGATTTRLPTGQEELIALYRTLLRGRKILVVLDNAVNPSQVRPLLPNAPGCGVLITSRNDLRGLVALQSAVLVHVGVLAAEHAHTLLANMIGAQRVAAEPDAVVEMAELCGYLPLALRIAAANVVGQPDGPLAEHVAMLRQGNRLASLEIEGDEEATVRTAFRLSYVALDAAAARTFRLLGLVAGPDFSVEAVAALTDSPDGDVQAVIEQLTVANLVLRNNRRRYQLHDLLRVFAAEQCVADDREATLLAAKERLLTFYFRHTESAAGMLYPTYVHLPRPERLARAERKVFADPDEAMAWMSAECLNVLAAVVDASDGELAPFTWLLVETLRPYLVASGRYREEGLGACAAALRAAEDRGDLAAIAAINCCLGSLSFRHGDKQGALHHFEAELAAYRAAGHVEGQARALISLGNLDRDVGRVDDGVARMRAGLELAEKTTNTPLRRFGWLGLSYAEFLRGNLDDAEVAARRTISLCDLSGEQATEGDVRGILGEILLLRGHCHEAIEQFSRSLELLRRGSLSHFEADVLGHLSRAFREVGDLAAAGRHARLALRIARDSSAREEEAEALTALAAVALTGGELDEAHQLYRSALAVCQEIGYRRGEIVALAGHAEVSRLTDDVTAAVSEAQKAVQLAEAAGLQILGMRAKVVLAQAELDNGAIDVAAGWAESAFIEARRCGAQLDQARALRALASARRAAGDPAAAEKYCGLADACLSTTGLPASSELRRSLDGVRGG
ncbi:AfsR/SARP family transcriptional regulator [Amycolatopsis solani]|uniref:AfsR/SARP family transcriptional regulator n=1 Tax=Amycolatopsis solani TaxID=3028615 RepID=UPI0025AF4DE4|nr:AfsR/SARP family transcriptional regulator [Amycolatopsis sp. MEP2-6]